VNPLSNTSNFSLFSVELISNFLASSRAELAVDEANISSVFANASAGDKVLYRVSILLVVVLGF